MDLANLASTCMLDYVVKPIGKKEVLPLTSTSTIVLGKYACLLQSTTHRHHKLPPSGTKAYKVQPFPRSDAVAAIQFHMWAPLFDCCNPPAAYNWFPLLSLQCLGNDLLSDLPCTKACATHVARS